jgi:hypothetical protein
MTKFYNYINEDYIEDIIQSIQKDCKPYLKELSGRNFLKHDLLTSGRNDSRNFAVKNIRQDRKPRDIYPDIHEFIDNELQKKFGIKARSQTLFCYSNVSDAANYGSAYYIFPIGDFEII